MPKVSACFLLILPVGIGLKHVLVINASKSYSYHIFKHPAAPAPIATKDMLIVASKVFISELEVKNPTAQVNITRDITLGFINRYNDLINSLKSSETVFLLIILDKRLSDMIDLFYIY